MSSERYQRNPSIVATEVTGRVILVPVRHKVGDLEQIYTLNETAACIWSFIDGQRSVAELRDCLDAEFEVSEGEAERDVADLIQQLAAIDAIDKV